MSFWMIGTRYNGHFVEYIRWSLCHATLLVKVNNLTKDNKLIAHSLRHLHSWNPKCLFIDTWGRAECRSDGMCGMQYWYVLADGGKLSGVCIAEYCDWGQDGMYTMPSW